MDNAILLHIIRWFQLTPYSIASDMLEQSGLVNKYHEVSQVTLGSDGVELGNVVTTFNRGTIFSTVSAELKTLYGIPSDTLILRGVVNLISTQYGIRYAIFGEDKVFEDRIVETSDPAVAIEAMVASFIKYSNLEPIQKIDALKFVDNYRRIQGVSHEVAKTLWYLFQDSWIGGFENFVNVAGRNTFFVGHFTISSLVIHPDFWVGHNCDLDFYKSHPLSANIQLSDDNGNWKIQIFDRNNWHIKQEFSYMAETFEQAVDYAIDQLRQSLQNSV